VRCVACGDDERGERERDGKASSFEKDWDDSLLIGRASRKN
jgi:hypothetical protein